MTQQQIFNKDFIFERIKDSNAPYWNLSLCQGFKNTANVMNYNGVDFEDDDSDATKIEKSIAQLDRTISTFPPDSVFVIELRGAMTSNRSGIFGPFQFSNTDRPAQPEPPAATTAPTLGTIPPGYVPESMLKGLETSLQSTFDKKLDALRDEYEQKRKEDEYNRRLEKLAESEKEVKEMKKSYESTVAKGTDILLGVVQRLGAMFLTPKGGAAAAMMAQQQLGAAQTQTPPPPDPKMDAVNDLADYLYDNYSADQIKEMMSNLISDNNAQSQGKQQADTDATANV